jgi:L-fuconolactonase
MDMDRRTWRSQVVEDALDPDLPVIDAHHHVWIGKPLIDLYELYDPEWLYADKAGSGHNVIATLFTDSHSAYRIDGPETLKVVGETEFAHGIAEEANQRGGREAGACATIVARADMLLGSAVGDVLDAHAAASPRFRGVRHMVAWTPELQIIPGVTGGEMGRPEFRRGIAELAKRDLSFDVYLLQPQLPQLTDLARAFPDTRFILDHLGTPMAVGRYAGKRAEGFANWKQDMAELATCPNVTVKVGGLNMGMAGVDALDRDRPFSSKEVAFAQRDFILTAIDLFEPDRCMFESNFPIDMRGISYDILWNGFKRITQDFSRADREMLFAGTARRVYKVAL